MARPPAQPGARRADVPIVRAMRLHLTLTLMGLVVFVVITLFAARACTSSLPNDSSLNPADIVGDGVAGLCANQQVVAAAGGASATTPDTLLSPALLQQLEQSDPSGLKALQQANGGSLNCPTTTMPGG